MERWIESETFLPAACSKVTSVVCRTAVCSFLFFRGFEIPAPGDIIPIQWTVRALLTPSHKMSLLTRIIEVKSLSVSLFSLTVLLLSHPYNKHRHKLELGVFLSVCEARHLKWYRVLDMCVCVCVLLSLQSVLLQPSPPQKSLEGDKPEVRICTCTRKTWLLFLHCSPVSSI